MFFDQRIETITRLIARHVSSPSLRHVRDHKAIQELARDIVREIDREPSVWRKWDAQREALLKAASRCWVPVEDGRVPSPYVLLTHLGTPWKPDSVTQAFVDGAKAAGVDRHLNDLRGTAITRFVLAGWNDEEVADVVGWELARVRNIRKHYVDAARIVMGLVSQLENAEKTG
ncbi:MAG: hypothetical protein V4820_03210 [Pseudomonadota bacterium]